MAKNTPNNTNATVATITIVTVPRFVADCIAHERCGGRQVKLPHDGRSMALHGLQAYVEDAANLLVGVPLRDQLQHTAFSTCQGRCSPTASLSK